MSNRLSERVVDASEAIGAFIETWGFKSIHGRVWSLLAMSTQPLPQIEVAEILGVSRSLVNSAIAELTEYGLVAATADHRNAPYEARIDVWPTITNVLRQREWMLMESARLALEAALREAENTRPGVDGIAFDARRIRFLLSMTEFAQTCLRGVLAIRVPRSLEPFTDWLSNTSKLVHKVTKRFPLR
jgi:DNA-binding transcriptional regulator GbsR (MarR family)